MDITELSIPDVKLLAPKRFSDHRGFFSETFNQAVLQSAGLEPDFVQDNHSLSKERGTLRGLHFQTPPHAQGKLVRVVHGSIFDVAVDIRKESPTYGKWVGAEISAELWNQIWVPPGFAHGFVTLHPDTEVIYKVTDFYAPECDKGIAWNDPDLQIEWPVGDTKPILSDKDQNQPGFAELPDYF